VSLRFSELIVWKERETEESISGESERYSDEETPAGTKWTADPRRKVSRVGIGTKENEYEGTQREGKVIILDEDGLLKYT
jgi:hypothetical protein